MACRKHRELQDVRALGLPVRHEAGERAEERQHVYETPLFALRRGAREMPVSTRAMFSSKQVRCSTRDFCRRVRSESAGGVTSETGLEIRGCVVCEQRIACVPLAAATGVGATHESRQHPGRSNALRLGRPRFAVAEFGQVNTLSSGALQSFGRIHALSLR
jgi:hypothetical protein